MTNEELMEKYGSMPLTELAAEIRAVKNVLDEKAASKTETQKLYDFLTITLVPEMMEEQGVETLKVADVGRLQTKADIRCQLPADNKQLMYQWLRDNGNGALIKDEVPSGTLKAFIKERIKEGLGYPDELLKISAYSRATVVKT